MSTSPVPRPPELPPEVLPDAFAELTLAHAAAAVPILEALLDWCALAAELERRLDEGCRAVGLVGDEDYAAVTRWSGVDMVSKAHEVIENTARGAGSMPSVARAMATLRGLT